MSSSFTTRGISTETFFLHHADNIAQYETIQLYASQNTIVRDLRAYLADTLRLPPADIIVLYAKKIAPLHARLGELDLRQNASARGFCSWIVKGDLGWTTAEHAGKYETLLTMADVNALLQAKEKAERKKAEPGCCVIL